MEIVYQLLVCLVVKVGFGVCSFGLVVPSGVFLPSMCVGACVGRVIGILMVFLTDWAPGWFDGCNECVIPGVYASKKKE